MLEKGKKISDYVLVEKIGHGGFGDVWLAEKRTPLSVSTFALKFFRPAEINQNEIETVQREIEVWQKISGLPNIISVIEADYVEDYIYIVSEFADGGSLQKWLAANGGKAQSIEQAVTIILEILNGLDYLHRTGFIHRDIKPANILIRKGTFCLADFGVTREIKTHSITQHTAGTYNYMPPEAFNKSPTVSPATDIWAVAVIFQELLTGRLPFAQTEIPSLMYAILHEEPDEMPGNIPSSLKLIVKNALHKNREDRYASAREMIDALKQARIETAEIAALEIEEKPVEIIAEEPKKEIPADTIYDDSFAVTTHVPENRQSFAPIEKSKSTSPAEKSPYQTVVVSSSSPKKLKRNKLLVAGIAGVLLFAVGAFFITAKYFTVSAADYFERGLTCAAQEDYECAVSNYGKAIENQPKYEEAYRHRAAVHYVTGNFAQAIPDYNRAIELNANDAGNFYGRGTAFLNSGDFNRAVDDFTKAIALKPQDAKYIYSRGLAFFRKNEFEKAVADYDKAIELDPNYAEAFNNRGNALDEQGKNNQAIADYTKAIKLDENFALAYGNRGTSYARKGEYNRALEDLNKSLKINPDLATSYFNRANIYYLKKNIEKALEDYDKFIETNPNNSLAFSNRAAIYVNKGNYAQAIEDYNRAVELNPQDAQNYYNRALVFEKLGNKEKAQSDRQKYNDLSLKR